MARQFDFWQKWLTYANVLTIGVGLFVAFAGSAWPLSLHNAETERVFFGGADPGPGALAMKNWLFGVIGGTIVGFHLLMVMLSEYGVRRRQAWAYRAMWYGLSSWFVIDSGISLYYGAVHNVIMINLVALFLIGLPLLMLRTAFTGDG